MPLVEGGRAARKDVANLDVFDCGMRGLWHYQQFTLDGNRQAESCAGWSSAAKPGDQARALLISQVACEERSALPSSPRLRAQAV
jgi:hypothetical protein